MVGKRTGIITGKDEQAFLEGKHVQVYNKLGAHPLFHTTKGWKLAKEKEQDDMLGVYFSVWAPHAEKVSLVGDFNAWDVEKTPMSRLKKSGIFECIEEEFPLGGKYKFAIYSKGSWTFKADPFGTQMELRPRTASIYTPIYETKQAEKEGKKRERKTRPISIYEIHPMTWRQKYSPDGRSFYNYRELAHELGPYLQERGFTHVELLGIQEHPLDASLGYQVTGYFAPTSRLGTPGDFQYFIRYMHQCDVDVIMDWMPVYFPEDEAGLSCFDGTWLFEKENTMERIHIRTGGHYFDLNRPEIRSFLLSNARFWCKEMEIDGLKIGDLSAMVYLDYDRGDGEWYPNEKGGKEKLEVLSFLKELSALLHTIRGGCLLIGEDSSKRKDLTQTLQEGGLGFDFGWENACVDSFCRYWEADPYFKAYRRSQLTEAPRIYAPEKGILALGHDRFYWEKSLREQLPGYYEDTFQLLRVIYAFWIFQPGKKLLFMGQEWGKSGKWDGDYPLNRNSGDQALQDLVEKDLSRWLHLYKEMPFLWEDEKKFEMSLSQEGTFWCIRGDVGETALYLAGNFTPHKASLPDLPVSLDKSDSLCEVMLPFSYQCLFFRKGHAPKWVHGLPEK